MQPPKVKREMWLDLPLSAIEWVIRRADLKVSGGHLDCLPPLSHLAWVGLKVYMGEKHMLTGQRTQHLLNEKCKFVFLFKQGWMNNVLDPCTISHAISLCIHQRSPPRTLFL